MTSTMLINEAQFADALAAAKTMSDEELRREAVSGRSRSYYVRSSGRMFPLKAIIRLAYRRAGLDWDGPHSNSAAAILRNSFDIVHIVDAIEEERLRRQRESVERWARPGQGKFRTALLDLFGSTCAISGCTALEAIDAAHIRGVANDGDENLENGWILRADLHRLFDAYLMSVDPASGKVRLAAECRSDYREFEDKVLCLPVGGPSLEGFAPHWLEYLSRNL